MAERAEWGRAYDEQERRAIASWSDDRFAQLVAAVEAGNHNHDEGWEDRPLADVFELRFIIEEAERRGLPALRIGPSRPSRRRGWDRPGSP